MKNNYLVILTSCLLSFLVFINFSAGPGVVANRALTTAPGEPGTFCSQGGCHGSGAFNQTTNIVVRDSAGDVIDSYEPGEDYDVSVEITANSGDPAAYGFQMVALLDADDSSTDSWSTNLPVTVHQVNLLSRNYLEHDGPNTTGNTFTIGWTAPEVGSGNVTFYAAGNAVNLNGSPSGDDADTTRLTLPELISSAVDYLDLNPITVQMYPNPANDYVNLSFEKEFEGQLTVYNLLGHRIMEKSFKGLEIRLDIENIQNGVYLLRMTDFNENRISTRKIMKE